MQEPFRSGLDLSAALRRVAGRGFASAARVLDPAFLAALVAAVSDGPFEPVPTEVGPVRQETESRNLEPGEAAEADILRRALTRLVCERGRGIRGLTTWRPNEVTVQRYLPGAIGITPHLDGKRYRRLVAVLTLEGTARFSIHGERDGPEVAAWDAGPGDLTLLRGPGLADLRDGRPFHAVGAPTHAPRLSLGLRMDARRPLPTAGSQR